MLGEASTKWYRTQAYYDSAPWRGTWALDGGALLNQGIHYVDLLRWCMGPAIEVTAVCTTQTHHIEVEDTALAVVRFASGAVGTIGATTAAYPGFPQRLEITGTAGHGDRSRTASWSAPPCGSPRTPSRRRGLGEVGRRRPGGLDAAVHAAQLADLLAAVDEGREPAVSGQDGRDALEIVRAVYESSRTGRPVRLAP